jgi:hypothetical protein
VPKHPNFTCVLHTYSIVNDDLPEERDLVFISYSHRRPESRERLLVFLKPWVRTGLLVVWADTYIKAGDRWFREIKSALRRARVGVLLVSQDFLASDFIVDEEVPELVAAADRGELTLICVPISAFTLQPPLPEARLLEFQWPRSPDQPIDRLDQPEQDQAWAEITMALIAAAGVTQGGPSLPSPGAGPSCPPVPLAASPATGLLGELHGVPMQRPHYIVRTNDSERIKAALLAESHAAVGISGTPFRLGLHGRGGIGKTVLATALANDAQVRCAFPDGVYWLSIGQQPDLIGIQVELARALGDPDPMIADARQGVQRLRTLWADRTSLLILDDLWSIEHVAALDVASPRSRTLVTTRDGALLTAMGAHEESIDTLDSDMALSLLARWVGTDAASLPSESSDVASECGYVPLALSVAGALARDGVRWADLVKALKTGRVRFLDHPSGNVFASMRLSVDFLPDDVRARYLELAVFPEDTDIPESTVSRLWAETGLVDDFEARRLLHELARKGLLYLDGASADMTVSFHDLQHDFLRLVAQDLVGLHGQLIDAYLGLRSS